MTTQIKTGEYLCTVVCPNCDRHVEVPCALEQVLKVKGAEGSLTVALSAKAVPHNCDQEELPFGDDSVLLGYVEQAHGEIAESLGEGTSMTVRHVDRKTGEIHEAEVVGRGVRL